MLKTTLGRLIHPRFGEIVRELMNKKIKSKVSSRLRRIGVKFDAYIKHFEEIRSKRYAELADVVIRDSYGNEQINPQTGQPLKGLSKENEQLLIKELTELANEEVVFPDEDYLPIEDLEECGIYLSADEQVYLDFWILPQAEIDEIKKKSNSNNNQ
jgi:hypothetical protein